MLQNVNSWGKVLTPSLKVTMLRDIVALKQQSLTSKRLSTHAIGKREREAIYILSYALDGLWRENRGSVNRPLEIANQSDCLKHHDYWVYIRVCWMSMRREIIDLPQLAIWWVLWSIWLLQSPWLFLLLTHSKVASPSPDSDLRDLHS